MGKPRWCAVFCGEFGNAGKGFAMHRTRADLF
jgi:hypothetical protein